jgi:hypothetical protein
MASLTKEQIDGRKAVQIAFIVANLEEAALYVSRHPVASRCQAPQ